MKKHFFLGEMSGRLYKRKTKEEAIKLSFMKVIKTTRNMCSFTKKKKKTRKMC